MTHLFYHEAHSDDLAQIAQLLHAVWPDEPTSEQNIAQSLRHPDHSASIARIDEQIVGLASGFLTHDSAGRRRWEVDLLAVDPAQRGCGIASELVGRSSAYGVARGAKLLRGLVAIDNTASQRTFARCGYTLVPAPLELFVAVERPIEPHAAFPADLHLVPVQTFRYQGAWLEGRISPESLQIAPRLLAARNWDTIGGLLPHDQPELIAVAQQSGYTHVGTYQWWQLQRA